MLVQLPLMIILNFLQYLGVMIVLVRNHWQAMRFILVHVLIFWLSPKIYLSNLSGQMYQGIQSRHYTRVTFLIIRITHYKHKQYGIQRSVTRTIHSAQGGTFIRVATEVSLGNYLFSLWYKFQLVVIYIRIKEANNTIFVGN